AVAMLREMTSPGYIRKRVPQKLFVVRGGGASPAVEAAASVAALETAGETATLVEAEAASAAIPFDDRAKAKMQGYEGEACGDCGNYTLVRNGTCMKCNTCGATSGCS
ncbi:MAG: hypothetical protein CML69_12595, partial [Rhodobacteraceae bacterium]|nr:hypothetical protein [Paracoccaceae bacterium]